MLRCSLVQFLKWAVESALMNADTANFASWFMHNDPAETKVLSKILAVFVVVSAMRLL